jgi:heat-inducible transcriptional repressor
MSPVAKDTAITERAQSLLKALIERYIRDGQPVGSRTLARDSRIDLSPASVRNVMADLEELGLVKSPHTSAGRVPTVQGYRLFVDTLLTIKPLQEMEVRSLRDKLGGNDDPQRVLEAASSLLSEITRMAGVVMIPRRERVTLRHLEFLPLSGSQVLVILVINERDVQNRIIQTARTFSHSELQQMANYLNQEFAGKDLNEVRESLLAEMRDVREHMNRLMVNAIEVASQAFSPEQPTDDYFLAGETHLMSYAEMADVNKLRHLFDAFNRKRDILHLLDQAIHAQGVQLFIGEESGYEVLDECSVVTAPYEAEGEIVGVLGVIGPTRMAYDRVIPVVDVAAKLLGAALNQAH